MLALRSTYSKNGTVHVLEWPAPTSVTIRVDRISEDSRHNTTAEILVHKTDAPEPHVHQARMNLTSTRTRADIARHCEARFPDLDWVALIEQTCVVILDKYREGEPAVNLLDVPVREGLRYRVEPIIYEQQANIIYGDGGLGKSMFALYLSCLIAAGCDTDKLHAEPGNVLYLDYEADPEEARERHASISEGLEIDRPPLMYRFCYQPIYNEVEALQRIVAEHGIDFVVVDSAGPACGGIPESAENALNFFVALRSLKVTSLTIAHVSKGGGASKGPYGSPYWRNQARSVWEVRKAQNMDEDSLEFSLWHRKVNAGKLLRPLAYRIAFGDGVTRLEHMDVRDSEELSKGLPLIERIRLALLRGSMQVGDIAEATGANAGTIRVTLTRHRDEFVNPRASEWGLASKASSVH